MEMGEQAKGTMHHGTMGFWETGTMGQRGAMGQWDIGQWDNGQVNNGHVDNGQCHNGQRDNGTIGAWNNR
jgi:hypothetical protein